VWRGIDPAEGLSAADDSLALMEAVALDEVRITPTEVTDLADGVRSDIVNEIITDIGGVDGRGGVQ
jgi:hypothetical protein